MKARSEIMVSTIADSRLHFCSAQMPMLDAVSIVAQCHITSIGPFRLELHQSG